jgi:hypothetical protein
VPVAEGALLAQGVSRSPARAAQTGMSTYSSSRMVGRLSGPSGGTANRGGVQGPPLTGGGATAAGGAATSTGGAAAAPVAIGAAALGAGRAVTGKVRRVTEDTTVSAATPNRRPAGGGRPDLAGGNAP